MKPGKIIHTFSSRDGRKVVLRTPTWNDLDELLALINSLVEEGANISIDERITREEEIDWLSKTLTLLEKDEAFYVVAEVNGRVVSNSELRWKRTGHDRHVGSIGIVIADGFRGLGIGTEMMRVLIEQARETGLKVLTLSVYANNERAKHLYERVGFIEVGRIPKKFLKDGEYIDDIVMTRMLE